MMEKIDELRRARDVISMDDHSLRLVFNTLMEIVDWIDEHEDAVNWIKEFQKMWYDSIAQTLLQCEAKDIIQKAQGTKITRYTLSNDKRGLMAHLKNGTLYHIHSDELSSDQIIIRNQLLEMERK